MLDGKGIIKQLRNPAYGLLPMIVFALLISFVKTWVAMLAGLGIAFIGVSVVRLHSRMLYDISAISFIFALVMEAIYPTLDYFSKFVLTEVIFMAALIASRLTRSKVIARLARHQKPDVRNYLSESFRVAFQIQYALFFHLLLILVFFVFSQGNGPVESNLPLILISVVIYISIIIIESLRLRMLDSKLNKEEWLPIVNESGQVLGRLAKSVTIAMKNKYLHPVVRVALINKGKVYLTSRKPDRILNPGMLDYPFEKYLKYNQGIDDSVRDSIKAEIGDDNIPLQFLLKYVFENEDTKRLVLLYASVIDDDDAFNNLNLIEGKLWTINQIDDNIGEGVFSECFELEFEYLKNTVLLKYTYDNNGV